MHRGGPHHRTAATSLLQLDLAPTASSFFFIFFGFVLAHVCLDLLGSALDQVLGFLEAQPGDGADFLDHVDLLVAGLGSTTVNSVFSATGAAAAAAAGGRNRNRSRGRNAPLLFEQLRQFGGFEDRQARQLVDDFGRSAIFSFLLSIGLNQVCSEASRQAALSLVA